MRALRVVTYPSRSNRRYAIYLPQVKLDAASMDMKWTSFPQLNQATSASEPLLFEMPVASFACGE
jgi:hypothetical protein